MIKVAVGEIKTHFERFLREAQDSGEEILVLRHGRPCGILTPLKEGDVDMFPIVKKKGKGFEKLIEQTVEKILKQKLAEWRLRETDRENKGR
jgi:antitoxin (DNA-binding transcriptional repressor) of toxin-antitoxin stability system